MLYDRLIGRDDNGNMVVDALDIHTFCAAVAEVGRGRLTGQQAQDQIKSINNQPIVASETQEAQTLLTTVTSLGTATAKLARAKEIEDVLGLAVAGAPLYMTPSLVKARLGV